ncbi:hypothetical protein JKP88DRAFT_255358 [Tribonema minus]|uniref:Uncharacterized protein n=1 Tax=Tribonema minus TaxID=303371 RepID=A0A835YZN7_9STRA|nr:hypothetical protein JKP88DRAFT_255358 [Tribonema minus]
MDRRHKAGILAESDGNPNEHQKSLLKRNLYNDLKTYKSLPRVYGCRLVRYNFASNSKFGRLFAGGASLQTFPRDFRAALTCGLLHDLDMVNCHMHIIAHCCRSHGIDCPLLTEYIACREAVLSRIAMANGLMRDDVKSVILKVTYGGRATYNSRPVHDTWLGMYAMECKRIAKQLCGSAESPHADLVTKSKTSNPLFSAVSKLACGVENCALGIALSILPTTTQAAALAFDGFMLCGDMPAGLQERMTDKIYEKIGARLPFVEKAIR